jgi:zinc-ribbon family
MFVIYGRRTARIKKYTDNQQACQSCKTFDLDIKVYRDYYHLFFIPVFPVGDKTVKIRCNNCGEPMRLETIQKHYESISKTPFYLFTFPILFAGLVLILVNANLNTQKEKALFVDNPKVGDVYRIRKDENNKTTYYFLRLVRISGDTVVAYHNNLEYGGFISKLNDDDFFVKEEELYFLKPELKQMLEKMEINSVDRDYGDYEGFNRIK